MPDVEHEADDLERIPSHVRPCPNCDQPINEDELTSCSHPGCQSMGCYKCLYTCSACEWGSCQQHTIINNSQAYCQMCWEMRVSK